MEDFEEYGEKEKLLKDVCSGFKSEMEALKILNCYDIDYFSLSVNEFREFSQTVLAVKASTEIYMAKCAAESKKRKEVKGISILEFLYTRCSLFVKEIDERGIIIQCPTDIIIEGECYDFRSGFSFRWDDIKLISKVITVLLDDKNDYVFSGLFESYQNQDEDIKLALSKIKKDKNVDKTYLFNVVYPDIRKKDPDKYYAIMNKHYLIYSRDHYLRDQFISLLDNIGEKIRSKVVICNPNIKSISSYVSMGFKLYGDSTIYSNYNYKEGTWVTDLTGFYALFDPYYFKDKRTDVEDSLIQDKYSFIRESALDVGFLKYYSFGETYDINFIPDYDHYIYTPHKPCFYLFPYGLLRKKGHQVFFSKMGNYYAFLSMVNKIRCSAYCLNMRKNTISEVFDFLLANNISTHKEIGLYKVMYNAFQGYFDFYTSYYGSGSLEYKNDDRRIIPKGDVTVLLPNEGSVNSLFSLSTKNIVAKRGYYLVSQKKELSSDQLLRYTNFKKKFSGVRKVSSGTSKIVGSGPFIREDGSNIKVERLSKNDYDTVKKYKREEFRRIDHKKWKINVVM